MKICSRGLLAAAAVCAPSLAHARDDAQGWATASAAVNLGGNWRFSQEVTARVSDNQGRLYELEMNSLLGYRLSRTVTIWAGYTHDPNYARDRTMMEHRARQQVSFDNFARLGHAMLSARFRSEARWREGMDGTGWRVRPYVKLTLPLGTQTRTALVLSHESFINLNTTGFQATAGYDRMRNLIAISTPITKNAALEIGYLNQHAFVRNGEDTSDHVGSVSLNFSL